MKPVFVYLSHLSIQQRNIQRRKTHKTSKCISVTTLVGFTCSLLCANSLFASETVASEAVVSKPVVSESLPSNTIFDTRTGESVSPTSLVNHLFTKPIVLIGETHDNPDHHAIEYWLLTQLLAQPRPPKVVFEMLDSTQTPALNALKNEHNTLGQKKPEAIVRKALNWDKGAWSWTPYSKQITYAINEAPQTLAGNISRADVDAILAGNLDISTHPIYQRSAKVSKAIRDVHLTTIFEQHCELAPKASLTRFVDVQLARDAMMAHALETHLVGENDITDTMETETTGHQSLLIAGAFHTDKTMGIPLQLTHPEQAVTLQMIGFPDSPPETITFNDIKAQAKSADYLWITSAPPPQDYCESLRKRFKP